MIWGAYHLTKNPGNIGWKAKGTVILEKISSKIVDYVSRKSFHSGWYDPRYFTPSPRIFTQSAFFCRGPCSLYDFYPEVVLLERRLLLTQD